MTKIILYFKRNPHLPVLGFILLIGLFFRTYQIVERFEFAHDGDLYSWIVKDIVVNHHPRLIGQLTSAEGIFIGPLFYYLLTPFFILTNMDPIGALIPITVLGILTIFSYYWTLSKIYPKEVGLISSFLYAVLITTIGLDRWVVPTVTTSIWAIWYFFVLINIIRRNFRILPILGILIGLIWHIHIALAPTLIAIPIAFLIAKKLPSKKQILLFLIIIFISLSPLFLFEGRHQFSQTKSLIRNFTANFGSGNTISEKKEIVLGKQNDFSSLNFDPLTKFTLEVQPNNPNINSNVTLKVTTKNPKYSTMNVHVDCGKPKEFEIGSISGEFSWSTTGCSNGTHNITASARIPMDPPWKTIVNKFINVLDKENRNVEDILISPLRLPSTLKYVLTFVVLLTPIIAWWKSGKRKEIMVIYSWILGVFLFFTFSSIIVSEYYLASINVLLIVSFSLIFSHIYKVKPLGKYFILILLSILLFKDLYLFISQQDYKKGYLEKKSIVEYITSDMKQHNYPCAVIGYISAKGDAVGFRYLFYLNKAHIVHSSFEVPVYNIVIPSELSSEVKQKFGHIGIIPPKSIPSKEVIEKSCQIPDTNVTDSLFGYVE